MRLSLHRTLALIAVTTLAATLVACGGGSAADPVLRESRVLSAAGGALLIDGAALTVPADALPGETELTLERLPADAGAGELLHLRLSPAGQRLAAAADLVLDLPGAPPQAQAFWDVGGALILAPATRSGDRFTLALHSLGFDGEGRRTTASAADQPTRRRALAAPSPAGGDLKLRVLDCQAKARALTQRLSAMLQRDAIDEAQLMADALTDLVAHCQALDVQQTQAEACTQRAAAAAAMTLSAPQTHAELDERMRDLLGTTDSVRKAVATCASAPDVNALLRLAIEQYTRVLQSELDAGRLEGTAGARELSRLFALDADCQLLGLDEACTVLRTAVFPAVLDGMRADAFAECRERGSSLPVSQLIDLGVFTGREGKFLDFGRYTMADLALDAAMCTGPELQVRVFGSDDALDDRPDLDTRLVALGTLASYTQRGEVRPPRPGRIVLSGPAKVSRCPDGTALGAELVVRLATDDHRGTELARRPHDGARFTLDSAPIDLSVPQILSAAGLDPASAAGVSLELTQEGGACTSLLDEDKQVLTVPVRLFRLDLVIGPAQGQVRTGRVLVETRVRPELFGIRRDANGTELIRLSTGYSYDWHASAAVDSGTPVVLGSPTPFTVGTTTVNGSASASVLLKRFSSSAECLFLDRELRTSTQGTLANGGPPSVSLTVSADGQLRVTASAGPARFNTVETGRETAQAQGVCDTAGLPREIGPTPGVLTAAGQTATVTGSVAPTDPSWQGEGRVERKLTGSACMALLPAIDLGGLTAAELACEATVRTTISWSLDAR